MTPDPRRFDVDVAPGGYAWWYLDALSDDGTQGLTIIAFIGSVFSPYYAHARRKAAADPLDHCAINVALYGRRGARWSMTERRRAQVVRDATRLAIGPSGLAWDGDRLRLRLDERGAPLPRPIRGTIDVRPDALSSHAVSLDAAGRHRWGVIAPSARIDVRLDAPALSWTGSAYLDSNRGDRPLEDDFVRWDWSRAHLGDGHTAVIYDVDRRHDGPLTIAHRFDADGRASAFEPPPPAALPKTRWRVARSTRNDGDEPPRIVEVFEDGPFYARSVVSTRWLGRPVTTVHEHVSLARFEQRWVRALLPFRMPRRFV